MATTTAAPQPAPQVSSIGRIFGALFNPKPTFESIAQRPSWLLPMILLIIMGATVIGIFSQRVGWRAYMERQDATNSRLQKQMEQMTPEQREQMISNQTKFAPIVGYVIVSVGGVIVWIIIAAVLMGLFNVTSGTQVGFSRSLAIVVHGWLPWLIHGLLSIMILFLKDPSTIDLQNLVASNPGAFLSSDAPKWLSSGLGSLDIFTFWSLALMALGFSAVNPKKISFGKAFTYIFAIWLVFVLIFKVALPAAFS